MGKATRWLKGLLGMKKEKENNYESSSISSNNGRNKENKRWSFHRSGKPPAPDTFPANAPVNIPKTEEAEWVGSYYVSNGADRCKYAIEVATATAAAADAAVVAAEAAEEVVRLTGGRRERGRREVYGAAAIMVQSVFRGYLARKALRALKGLVKIQALVRGYLVRKKAAATLYSMKALIRAQNAARSQRARRSMNKENRFLDEFRGRRSMENHHSEVKNEYYSKRLSPSYENSLSPFEESPKIVEIDTYKPRSRSRRMSTSVWEYSEDSYYQTISSPLPCPLTSRLSIPKSQKYENYECGYYDNEYKFTTAHSTPRFTKSYKYNGKPTPSKSVCGDSLFSLYSNHPSYMANTQSFNAKLRSSSAPRHRPELMSKKRMSLDEILASRNSLSGVKMQRSCSQVQQTLNI